jgi:hypothetical protein
MVERVVTVSPENIQLAALALGAGAYLVPGFASTIMRLLTCSSLNPFQRVVLISEALRMIISP